MLAEELLALLPLPSSTVCQLTFYLKSDNPRIGEPPYAYGKCVLRFQTKFNPGATSNVALRDTALLLPSAFNKARHFQRSFMVGHSLRHDDGQGFTISTRFLCYVSDSRVFPFACIAVYSREGFKILDRTWTNSWVSFSRGTHWI